MVDNCYTAEQAALVQRVRTCRDHHEVMGLPHNCSRWQCSLWKAVYANYPPSSLSLSLSLSPSLLSLREDVLKAYRQLAVLLHPDKNQAPGSEEAFKTLIKAKDSLLSYRWSTHKTLKLDHLFSKHHHKHHQCMSALLNADFVLHRVFSILATSLWWWKEFISHVTIMKQQRKL